MFSRIVVGTDGSETAKQAVREATELAKQTGASLDIVSAYDPVPSSRLREERLQPPSDIEHAVNPRQQGHDGRQALPARKRAEQGLAPRAQLGSDRPNDLTNGRGCGGGVQQAVAVEVIGARLAEVTGRPLEAGRERLG